MESKKRHRERKLECVRKAAVQFPNVVFCPRKQDTGVRRADCGMTAGRSIGSVNRWLELTGSL